MVEIAQGPTFTRYEIRLAPGIRVGRIESLGDNIAMNLAALDVRIQAPIPGKAAIGIEVPNKAMASVSLREVLEAPEFREAASKLSFALGKDVTGKAWCADLTRMPHLLIGGATNSGKSVCLNVLIASILFRARPDEVKFLLIDPKRVELSLFDGIPHLIYPVITDIKKAAGMLNWAITEMERRYDLFVKAGSRDINSYNRRAGEEGLEFLPYIVIVVDELADLMMQVAADVEPTICRLAQLARATGIHLVIATQRPSVDVITGLIKANISSRIAFAVSSHIDSRTILDKRGAERLLGRGDMLFDPIGASKPVRIQGAYISEKEVETLVEYLRRQATPNYTAKPVEAPGGAGGGSGSAAGGGDDAEDDVFEDAVRLVVTTRRASTSMLQRKFSIGYTRAARLIDMMEERGIVSALDGAKPREVLASREQIEQFFRSPLNAPGAEEEAAGEDEGEA
ncbi:MAG: DNA translocase SpoIIIE [Alphaproteobacteria bacterium ADurb.BinA305]|nr:MAG: DNA translocase SpoIIIE [Alphaproteobacteria bacterium ADurb.BinA305]